MKYFVIVICVIWLALHYHAHHVYKTKVRDKDKYSLGWLLGSVIGMITDALAWYWLFRLT